MWGSSICHGENYDAIWLSCINPDDHGPAGSRDFELVEEGSDQPANDQLHGEVWEPGVHLGWAQLWYLTQGEEAQNWLSTWTNWSNCKSNNFLLSLLIICWCPNRFKWQWWRRLWKKWQCDMIHTRMRLLNHPRQPRVIPCQKAIFSLSHRASRHSPRCQPATYSKWLLSSTCTVSWRKLTILCALYVPSKSCASTSKSLFLWRSHNWIVSIL